MRKAVYTFIIVFFGVCAVLPRQAHTADGVTSLAIVDFYNLSQNPDWQWLGKGLADMLVTDLSAVNGLQLVDREDMQSYMREIKLSSSSGLVGEGALVQLAKMAKVDRIVFGTYQIEENDRVKLRGIVVDIVGGTGRHSTEVIGALKDALHLQKQLARNLVKLVGGDPSPVELGELNFQWTQSLDAAAHFYTALDHYDQGNPALALAEVSVAARIDNDYLPARFWKGRLYIELAEFGHAELALHEILADARTRPYKTSYVLHTSLLLAHLYEKFLQKPGLAVAVLEPVRQDSPDSMERLNINVRLGRLYRLVGDFDRALQLFVRLFKRLEGGAALREKYVLPYRSVNLVTSMRQMLEEIEDERRENFLLSFYNGKEIGEIPGNMIALSPQNPSYTQSPLVKDKKWFYAPRGMRFKTFTFEFQGGQKKISIHPIVYLSQAFDQTGQKENIPAPVHGKSRHQYSAMQEMIQAFQFGGYLPEGDYRWSVSAEFMPVSAPQPGSVDYWHTLLRNNTKYPVIIDTPGHIGGKLALHEDARSGLHLLYDTNVDLEESGDDSDIWAVHAADKESWGKPSLVPELSSSANDHSPHLAEDDLGRLITVFVSDRSGDEELWLALSTDGKRWERPRRIVLPEEAGEKPVPASPRMFRDQGGVYRLAFFEATQRGTVLIRSLDLTDWTAEAVIPAEGPAHLWNRNTDLDYFQDSGGVYRLVLSASWSYNTKMKLGSSNNAIVWNFQEMDVKSDTHPRVFQDKDGKYVMIASSDGKGLHYPRQLVSSNWYKWHASYDFPRIFYHADAHMKPTDILQDSRGYYWVAFHKHFDRKLQIFRLGSFPATKISQAYPLKPHADNYARMQLAREQLVIDAIAKGDDKLANCLRHAHHYKSCLNTSKTKAWWRR